MKRKNDLWGILSAVLAVASPFLLVNAYSDLMAGCITFSGFCTRATFSAIMSFIFSSAFVRYFFKKIGKISQHSAIPFVAIGVILAIISIWLAIRIVFGQYGINPLFIFTFFVFILFCGFLTGFGLTAFGVSQRNREVSPIQPSARVNDNIHTVSKTVAAILAFLFGSLGVHRYYLGYKKLGGIQTGGFISFVIAYSLYAVTFIYDGYPSLSKTILVLLLALFSAVTSIWAFIDFIRILTGGLLPATGTPYTEDFLRQSQTANANDPASNTIDTITKLANLYEQGVLTEEEFQQKKAELLAKI